MQRLVYLKYAGNGKKTISSFLCFYWFFDVQDGVSGHGDGDVISKGRTGGHAMLIRYENT